MVLPDISTKTKKYLNQLEEIKRESEKSEFKKARGIYKEAREYEMPHAIKVGNTLLIKKYVDSIETAAVAHELMRQGVRTGETKYSLLGAQLYAKIGKGEKAIPRLLKTVKNAGENLKEKDWYQIENFIKKNAGKRGQSAGGLETKFGVFIAFLIGGVALSLGSLTITGNAVSNLTQTTPGLLGILLFIAGLVGMFFYSRKR